MKQLTKNLKNIQAAHAAQFQIIQKIPAQFQRIPAQLQEKYKQMESKHHATETPMGQ